MGATPVEELRRTVEGAFSKMGVALLRTPELPADQPGWIDGPAGAWLNANGPIQRVWLSPQNSHSEAWFWVLHELEHLVFWRDDDPDLNDATEQLMMPWGIGVLRASGLPASLYMRSAYNSATTLPEMYIGERRYTEVADWKRPLQSAWFRRAREANIAAGTLDANGLPTWRRPDWSRIRVEDHKYT